MKTLTASEFKARCLAVLDDVARTGDVVVITKRGREVARLVGPAGSGHAHPQDGLDGTVSFLGDVIGPAVPADEWGAVAEQTGDDEPPSR